MERSCRSTSLCLLAIAFLASLSTVNALIATNVEDLTRDEYDFVIGGGTPHSLFRGDSSQMSLGVGRRRDCRKRARGPPNGKYRLLCPRH